jgi:hypothetical protein
VRPSLYFLHRACLTHGFSALFVQPRYAKLMDTSALIHAMGVPPEEVPKPAVSGTLTGEQAAP